MSEKLFIFGNGIVLGSNDFSAKLLMPNNLQYSAAKNIRICGQELLEVSPPY